MTININIAGWKISGFRCPDHSVDFYDENENIFNVSLLQMPNGTGKTTTLQLLKYALSGSAESESPAHIRSFKKRNSDVIHGIVEIKILHSNKKITFVMIFDFDTGRASYKTTSESGQATGFNPPREIRKFLTKEFIDYFILDGELANRLLNKSQSAAQTVIDSLFQVDLLKKLSLKAHDYWQLKSQNYSGTGEVAESRRINKLETLKNYLELRTVERDGLVSQRQSLMDELTKTKNQFDELINADTSRFNALSNANDLLKESEILEKTKTTELFEAAIKPQNLSYKFGEACLALKNGLDKAKLPETAAREFFEDLCNEVECICGRIINPEISEVIKIRATKYLGSDDVSLLNSLKTSINESVGIEAQQIHTHYLEQVNNLAAIVVASNEKRAIVEELKTKAGEVDPQVKDAQTKIQNLTVDITKLDGELSKYSNTDDTLSDEHLYNLDIISKRLNKAEEQVAEITNTLDIRRKTEKLRKIFDSSYDKASKLISKELVIETNLNIKKWLPNNDISLDQINGHLLLKNQAEGSAGENLSVAYSFLGTLFNRATHSLPFIVDSPAGALANDVRREIGSSIPKMTKQFITFVISSERQGFIQGGIDRSGKSIQYITIFKKHIEEYYTKSVKYNPELTLDGVIVNNKDFFNNFQLESDVN